MELFDGLDHYRIQLFRVVTIDIWAPQRPTPFSAVRTNFGSHTGEIGIQKEVRGNSNVMHFGYLVCARACNGVPFDISVRHSMAMEAHFDFCCAFDANETDCIHSMHRGTVWRYNFWQGEDEKKSHTATCWSLWCQLLFFVLFFPLKRTRREFYFSMTPIAA